MKVLLIDPGKKYLEKEYTRLIKPYPNIGLIYIGTYLQSKGIAVDFLDVEIEKITDQEFGSYLLEKKPDIVGITTLTYMIQDAYHYAEAVKKADQNIKVVFGGAHASALSDEVLANENVDVAVLAEGELVLENIVKLLKAGEFNSDHLKNIDGIAFRDANHNIIKTKITFMENLDQLPFPDWSLAPYHKYAKINSHKYGENIPLYQISASRGCPFRCAFCFPLHGRKVRGRSSQNIFMEMKHLRKLLKKFAY
ncbi:MAG: cobalamin-dependent protein [Firmicutes bacterium]|nr:cobalamin-dependent protein [Bacillota bacterium]